MASRTRGRIGQAACLGLSAALLAGCHEIRQHEAGVRAARGWDLIADEDYDAALAEFNAVVELNPKLAVAHRGMGFAYRRKGEFEKAARCFAEALKLCPFSFEDAMNLAQVNHLLDRFQAAIRAYLHACDLEPGNFEAHLNLGVCYHQTGEYERARQFYERAIDIQPDSPIALSNLGAVYDAQGKYYEAIRAYKRSLELDSNQPMIVVNWATTLIKQERFREADTLLKRAIECAPGLAMAHERLAYCLFRQGHYDQATASYDRAIELDGKLASAHAGRGAVLMARYLQDRADQDLRMSAIDSWHRSLELDPDQPRIKALVRKYQPANPDPEQVLLGQ